MKKATRKEKDSLGEREIPAEAYWGVHTLRSIENFPLSGRPLPLDLIYAMVRLKKACAAANRALGELTDEMANAISSACDRVLEGALDDQFPVDLFQAGSGTSSNMNVNEVLASAACEALGKTRGDRSAVHPNDHINRGQSTNNVFPSAIRVACRTRKPDLSAALKELIGQLCAKANDFKTVVKSARTHLQDAVPMTLGQTFSAWARALEKDGARLDRAFDTLRELGIGGNAIGTGINTPRGFRAAVIEALNHSENESYCVAEDGVEITQFLTDFLEASGALRMLATDLHKICNDLRLLSSGPRTGLGELSLEAIEPGSSIMPGKINPSLCEAVNMICLRVSGNDLTVAQACAAGQLELNTHMPVVGVCLLESMQWLTTACRTLSDRSIATLRAHEDTCRRYLENSAALATLLNPRLGYDRVAELVKTSLAENRNLRELVLEKKLMTETEFDALLSSALDFEH